MCDVVRNCLWLATALRMTILGTTRMCSNVAPVTGEVLWLCSQCWMARLSYVCPSAAITGSTNISCRKAGSLCAQVQIQLYSIRAQRGMTCSCEWVTAKACNAELMSDSNNRGDQWYHCSIYAGMCTHVCGCKNVTDKVTDRHEQKR